MFEFRLLGPVELLKDGLPLQLGGSRQRTLLVALLLRANEPVATGRLIDEMWGEDAPETATKVVQNAVSQLRKLLSHDVLVKRSAGYQLEVEPEHIDARRFELLVAEAREASQSGDAASASATLREALDLWRGPALADAAETPFVLTARARLEELRAAAIEDRIDADLAAGDSSELVAELEALVAQQPLRERLRGQLMTALYRAGRQADALSVYRDTRRILVDELGVEPSPALQRLQQSILVQDPALEPELPSAPPPSPQHAARKTVSVAFADLVPLGPRLDPEAEHEPVAALQQAVSDAFARHGGAVEPAGGGSVLAVFGIPAVHEDDPLRAVRAALEARGAASERLGVRVGIATGAILSDAGPPAGEPLDEARRLCHAAEPGEILLGEEARRVLAGAVETERGRLVALAAGASLVPRRLDTPFVGRQGELAQLRQAFERAVRERSPSLFTVLGVAGIGKSRLASEFTSSLDAEATVLAGRCLAYGDGTTLWPLAEMLGQLGQEPAGPPIAAAEVEETFRAIRKLFETLARRRPLVLVVEDAHWAEPTLLDLLDHVLDWSGDVPILIVCLARPELLETRSSWGGGKRNATAIQLGSLSESDSQTLIEHLTGDLELPEETVARVTALAEGNPLFLEQMLAMLRERGAHEGLLVPPTIHALLAARLDLLEPHERAVLERAAVIGREFALDAVVELTPAESRPHVDFRLEALLRRGLIRPQRADDAFEFRHALMREAAYDAVPKRVRAELHEQLAQWLEATGREEIVGHHLEQAARYKSELGDDPQYVTGLRRKAAQRLAAAGRNAYAWADLPAAVALLGRAAALHDPDAPHRLELLVDWGEALREHGDLEQAAAVLAEAAAATAEDPALEAQVRLARLRLQLQVDPTIDTDSLAAEAKRAVEIFEHAGNDRQLAKAWELAAWAPWFRCRAAEADAAAARAVEHARRAGDSRTEAQSLHLSIGAAYFGPTPVAQAVERCEEVLARRSEQSRVQASALRALAGLTALGGDPARARELVEQHRALVADFGLRVTAASASETYGLVELLAGDEAAAEAEFRRGYEALEALGERFLSAILAALYSHALDAQGRSDEALRASELSEQAAGADDLLAQVQWRTARAKALAHLGRPGEAESLAREAVALIGTTDFLIAQGDALLDLAEVLRVAGLDAAPVVGEAVRVYSAKGAVMPGSRARALLRELEPQATG